MLIIVFLLVAGFVIGLVWLFEDKPATRKIDNRKLINELKKLKKEDKCK